MREVALLLGVLVDHGSSWVEQFAERVKIAMDCVPHFMVKVYRYCDGIVIHQWLILREFQRKYQMSLVTF